jgi:hypothetical protein
MAWFFLFITLLVVMACVPGTGGTQESTDGI